MPTLHFCIPGPEMPIFHFFREYLPIWQEIFRFRKRFIKSVVYLPLFRRKMFEALRASRDSHYFLIEFLILIQLPHPTQVRI